MSIEVGCATKVINPEIGDDLSGQYYRRFVEYHRDNLEANALYLANQSEQVLIVNCDLAGLLERDYVQDVCAAVEAVSKIPARNVIITGTHTHAGPDTCGLVGDAPKNLAYMDRLKGWIVEIAQEALRSVRPAKIGWGLGRAHIGYNRRVCWADGSHSMYGDTARKDFTGLEGPDDPTHAVLFATGETGKPIVIMHNNCCHATCTESASFSSADFPGEARRLIREALNDDIPILYMQGASGDTAPRDQLNASHMDGDRRLKEMGLALASETLRLIYSGETTASPELKHIFSDLKVGVRLPTEEELSHAREMIALGEEKVGRFEYINSISGVMRLYNTYKDEPSELLAIHALRVGDYALITNPCELYCQFGLDIKRRSPAGVTAVAQLADGFSGYCPTIPALMGGGYSAFAIYWCRLEEYAGYKIVEESSRLLHQLWIAKE